MTPAAVETPDGPRWASLHALGRAADRAHACFVAGIGAVLGLAVAYLLTHATPEAAQTTLLWAGGLAVVLTVCIRILELYLADAYRALHKRLEGVPEPEDEGRSAGDC